METTSKRKLIAWIAVTISALFINLWSWWGINENFHEGWYHTSFWNNLLMMFGQYLLVPIGFIVVTVVSIIWNRVGSVFHLLLAVGAILLFGKMNAGLFFVIIPLLLLSQLYWFGKLEKRRLAYFLVIGIPLLVIVGYGIFFGIRMSLRFNDNNFEARKISGNGVELIWAPQGPGWPDNGNNWYEAKNICSRLREDGKSLSDSLLNIWRLPTANEAVRSMVHHGKNAGGVWNEKIKSASYKDYPDKESPLWNMYLKTIYWWTSTQVDSGSSYIVVYNGGVWPRKKVLKTDYLNFRAVKEIK